MTVMIMDIAIKDNAIVKMAIQAQIVFMRLVPKIAMHKASAISEGASVIKDSMELDAK